MKLFLVVFFIFLSATAASADSGTFTLSLKIRTFQDAPIYVAIFKSESSFLEEDEAVVKRIFQKNDNDMYVVAPLQEGKYALSVFQDINMNGELDTSFLGAPKEPYGFSNNAEAMFGPPSYDECVFSISNDMIMEVVLE